MVEPQSVQALQIVCSSDLGHDELTAGKIAQVSHVRMREQSGRSLARGREMLQMVEICRECFRRLGEDREEKRWEGKRRKGTLWYFAGRSGARDTGWELRE